MVEHAKMGAAIAGHILNRSNRSTGARIAHFVFDMNEIEQHVDYHQHRAMALDLLSEHPEEVKIIAANLRLTEKPEMVVRSPAQADELQARGHLLVFGSDIEHRTLHDVPP